MKSFCIPPSPNWYSQHVSDGTANGLYAFAAKNSVVIFDVSDGPPCYKDTILVSSGRVICVAFCRSEVTSDAAQHLLTVSDDKCLRVWDVQSKTIHRETLSPVPVVDADWRGNLSASVLFSGEKNSLHAWDLAANNVTHVQTYCQPQQQVSIVRCHPKDPDIAALGYKSGLIVVQGLKKGSNVVYRLKGHTEDILSLSWSPCEEKSGLVSTALDRTLKVWDVEGENAVSTLTVPGTTKNRKIEAVQKGKSWVVATLLKSGVVVCSTPAGDVCSCDTSSPKSDWSPMATDSDSAGHSRPVFNLSLAGPYAVSTSLDRNVVFWDVSQKRSAYCLPTLGGFPYHLAFSPMACASLSIAAGDGTVKVCRTDCPSNPYSSISVWQGIRGRVMTAAWHPTKEDLIGFGTDDGKVGVVHLGGKQTTTSASHHRQTTYVVCWADLPDPASGDAVQIHLLSCGDGRIKVHRFPKMDAQALDLHRDFLKEDSTSSGWTAVGFHAELRLLVLGNSDGSIHAYDSQTRKKVALLEGQRKAIENVVFHPTRTAASSPRDSSLKYILACSSCEGPIHLYDLQPLAEKREDILRMSRSTTQLLGHGGKVVCLAWSGFHEGRLVSASYDGTVQIWDAVRGEPLANFRGHEGRAISCCWSVVDPEEVFSGGEDCTVRRWKVSEQQHRLPPSKAEKQKAKAPKPPPSATETEVAAPTCIMSNENQENSTPDAQKQTVPSQSTKSKKKKAPKSFFPVFSARENKPKESVANDCMLLAKKIAEGDREPFFGEDAHLNMFLGTEGVLSVADAEIARHKEDLNFSQAYQMMAWRGNLAEALREAAETRKLSDTLVALAPSVSRALWLEMCERYAEQLSSEGEHHHAALYFLASRKTAEATRLLVANGLTREALVVAKAHLLDDEAEEIYGTWAERAKAVGNYEQAAKCRLATGDPAGASKSLLCRRDPKSRRAAAYVAKAFGLSAEAEAAFAAAFETALEKQDWETAGELVEEHNKPSVFRCLIEVHRCLVEALAEVKSEEKASSEANEPTGSGAAIWKGRGAVAEHFLVKVREAAESWNVGKSAELLEFLKHMSNLTTEQAAVFRSAIGVTLALTDLQSYEIHLGKALCSISAFSKDLFIRICSFFFSTDLESKEFRWSVVFDDFQQVKTVEAETFRCPESSSALFEHFKSMKRRGVAETSPAREGLGLLFCAAVLDSYEERRPVCLDTVDLLRRLEALLTVPSLSCVEHVEKKLRRREEKLLQKKAKAAAKSAEEAPDEEVVSLEESCEELRKDVKELREATRNCSFPDVSGLMSRMIALLESSSDEETLCVKSLLTAWRKLILNDSSEITGGT